MNQTKTIAPWFLLAGTVISLLIAANNPTGGGLLLMLALRLLSALAVASLILAGLVALALASIVASIYRIEDAEPCFFQGYCLGWLVSFAVSIVGFPVTLFVLDELIYGNTTKDAGRIFLYLLVMLIWAALITGGAALNGFKAVRAKYSDR